MNADYPTIIDILLMNAITDILWMGADGPVIIDILFNECRLPYHHKYFFMGAMALPSQIFYDWIQFALPL